jgi:hypothetical protein
MRDTRKYIFHDRRMAGRKLTKFGTDVVPFVGREYSQHLSTYT